jgi:hypothetical protein
MSYERQGSGYDPHAHGYERQGRDSAPVPFAQHAAVGRRPVVEFRDLHAPKGLFRLTLVFTDLPQDDRNHQVIEGDFEDFERAKAFARAWYVPGRIRAYVYNDMRELKYRRDRPPPAVDHRRPIAVTKLAGIDKPKRRGAYGRR